MAKKPKKPKTSPDPHVAAFQALREANRAFLPGSKGGPIPAHQKPRPKQQIRRRP